MEPDPKFTCECERSATWVIRSETGETFAACDEHTLRALNFTVPGNHYQVVVRRVGTGRVG